MPTYPFMFRDQLRSHLFQETRGRMSWTGGRGRWIAECHWAVVVWSRQVKVSAAAPQPRSHATAAGTQVAGVRTGPTAVPSPAATGVKTMQTRRSIHQLQLPHRYLLLGCPLYDTVQDADPLG